MMEAVWRGVWLHAQLVTGSISIDVKAVGKVNEHPRPAFMVQDQIVRQHRLGSVLSLAKEFRLNACTTASSGDFEARKGFREKRL
jgi:hypothetical protein